MRHRSALLFNIDSNEPLGAQRSFTIETVVHAALWMLTTSIALRFGLGRQIQQHRQWMTRSYAVAILFLENRVIVGLGGWSQNIAKAETVTWVTLALSLLFARHSDPVARLMAKSPS